MALVVKDRVKETTTTTGTGTYTLAGAVTGFQSFGVIGNANTTYYSITNGTDWEVGIGTYTASGTTLSRDTILESSNSGNAVNWGAGSKDIFVTYPAERAVYLNGAGTAVDDLDVTTLDVATANITTANITAGTVSTTPVSSTDIANKLYVDNLVSSGIHFHTPVRVESPTALTVTYNNGSSGVGATLTNAGAQAALVIDGVTLSLNDRVLIYTQTDQTQNGIYYVSNVGSVSTNWVLTRATDADSYGLASPDTLGEGSTVFVQQGTTGAGETYLCNTVGTITFGTTNITFVQISSAQIYSAGTGLTLTGTQFSLSNVGTAGTYGSASQVPVFMTNAQGQVTSVTNTSIAIAGSAITSGTVAIANGGTGQSTYTDGQLLIGNTSGNTLTKATLTAGTGITVTNGNGSITVAAVNNGTVTSVSGTGTVNGITLTGTVTSSGSLTLGGTLSNVSLSTQVTGTLPVTNGGTGLTTVAQGDLLYASASNTLVALPKNTTATRYLANTGTSNNPAWAQIDLSNGVTGDLPFANLAQGTALSVLGVTGNATADNASIAAGTDHQVLRRSGTSVGFGALALNQSAAVTGTLAVTNGGTGITSFGTGVATWLGTPSSANLAAAVTDETGSGALVFANTPTLVTPVLGAATGTSLALTGGSLTTRPAATQDGVVIAGRAGGTSTYNVTITPTTLTASRTLTLANGDTTLQAGTMAVTGTGLGQFASTTSSQLAGVISDETGSGSLVFATSPTLVTPVLGTPTSGTLSNCTVDGTDAVGFRNTPVNSQSAAYTLVLADAGKTILHPISDNNARTFTIPANSSVAYPVGTVITFINLINTVTIAITSDTMYLAGDGSTGSRTLAAYGVATAVKLTSTSWLISGNGLT